MSNFEYMELDQPDRPRLSFREKWELYKPILEKYYLDEKLKLLKIKNIMREQLDFDAEVHQYKYQFGKWGWLKILKTHEKERLLEIAHKRGARGEATAIMRRGQVVDTKKLDRHAKTHGNASQIRFQITTESAPLFFSIPLVNNKFDFLNWNVPYVHMMQQRSLQIPRSSPRGSPISIPSDFEVTTPPSNAITSPRLANAAALMNSARKSDLFVTGKFDELLKSFDHQETKIFSTWLYQFWTFGFVAAKHWGRGPRIWTANELWNGQNVEMRSETHPYTSPSHENLQNARPQLSNILPVENILPPSPLCLWSIHIDGESTVYDNDEDLSTSQERDSSSNEWPPQWFTPPFEQTLQQAFESNCFSTIDASDLPVNLSLVAKAVTRSPIEIFKEGLGFAIMGQNFDLVNQMLSRADQAVDLMDLYLLHLALSYLDGSKSCCHILQLLLKHATKFGCSPNDRSPNGYTLLDTLMITILRNHSTVSPQVVDDMLRTTSFPGNEIDVCGRWDAESDAYRSLVNSGATSIPPSWKHKFCHTSIQAVCHCIYEITYAAPLRKSGLFSKRCFSCGLKLEVSAMHTLVLTVFHLLKSGIKDEDIFGMICCLLMLIFSYGSRNTDEVGSFFEKSHVSIDLLFGKNEVEDENCTHEEFYPAEFAGRLEGYLEEDLNSTVKQGWQVFNRILQLAQDQYNWVTTGVPPTGYEHEHDELVSEMLGGDNLEAMIFHSPTPGFALDCEHLDWRYKSFGRNRVLGHIWAACQAELLTYRRLTESDSWISGRISVGIIQETLEREDETHIPLIENKMIQGYCPCGSFGEDKARRQQACQHYFANMDDWSRSQFLFDGYLE